jgi:two-component system NarL family sensor kinase
MPENLRRLPAESEITVFRVVQECLTNVHRHANTRSCAVKIFQDQNQLFVTVSDSGKGIPKDKQLSVRTGVGVGLRGMRERLKQLGGTLELASNENGTIVTATLALSEGSSSRREG